jgi:threonine dehydratase
VIRSPTLAECKCVAVVAEGAAATPLAAALKDRERRPGKVVLILSGGNVDTDVYAQVLGA